MENGSFQTQLKTFEFDGEDEFALGKSPFSAPPERVQYSPALEALFQQNEDLSVRLKVTLQRLSQFESSLSEETEKSQKLLQTQSSLQDQLMIWKEKERLWLEKIDKSELQIEQLNLKIPKYTQLQNEIQRYKKYHEKVKTQVKPYLQQLKDYSNNLVGEIRALHQELAEKEDMLTQKATRVLALETELKLQLGAHETAHEELNKVHAAEVKSLQSQIHAMKESLILLEARSERLDQALERQDELDNMLVVLSRKADDAEARLISETEGLRQTLQMTRNDLLKRNMQIEDSESKQAKAKEDNSLLHTELQAMNEQLTSLRYLWNDKAEENEKLKNSISALEKINQELSRKLSALRQNKNDEITRE
jgi:chromosome segregation ATPase